ncbi:hypothetical protein WBP06_23390 [Novosphingobium sp. BL-8H]|uniref:hypothetical protein n=1 Tax=Novosphingobium sp. BL-8H TaxID=3127640 RepID=UPI003756C237
MHLGAAGRALTLDRASSDPAGTHRAAADPARRPTVLGVNLYGLQTFNRQPVFANLMAQGEWMSSRGESWTGLPAEQLDASGWVRFLRPGEKAPHMLMLPSAPFRPTTVHCTYAGKGELTADGVARIVAREANGMTLALDPTGKPDEMAWIELLRTDPQDPIRNIDCRREGVSPEARFDPEFLSFLSGFKVIRFLDWQQVNDNLQVEWATRTVPSSASQAGPAGASIEDMVDLANAVGADPWFVMPYNADAEYLRNFARLVHGRLDRRRTVYVEFGNEVWNGMFGAAQQAEREGMALGLGDGHPFAAQAERYSERMVETMQIWTAVYADRPGALVRVCSAQNGVPEMVRIELRHRDAAQWVDAVAAAPYIGFDLAGFAATGPDVDRIFAGLPGAIDHAFEMADANRAVAAEFGKRFVTYEGGQHLVTGDLELARAVQRDPRMGAVYARYIDGWQQRFGDTLMLYASTAPIAGYGSWGLREYAGQPMAEAPKLAAVRRFQRAYQ